jgi:hypothetical protein
MNIAQLWERKTDRVVSAELLPEMTPEQVVQTGGRWQRFRIQARARLRRERAPVPEDDHWDWDEKSHDLKFTAYRCLGIRYEDEIQGLMMISTLAVEGRLPVHKGKPVLYVKYIESAPWNLKAYVGAEARFGGIGIFSDSGGGRGQRGRGVPRPDRTALIAAVGAVLRKVYGGPGNRSGCGGAALLRNERGAGA